MTALALLWVCFATLVHRTAGSHRTPPAPTYTTLPPTPAAVTKEPVVEQPTTIILDPSVVLPTLDTVIAAMVAEVQLTESQVDTIYALADVPLEWREPLKRISFCESSLGTAFWHPRAVGDHGSSLGMHQIWFGWFTPDEDPFDPVTNTRVAVRVRELRGRFGGGGGWSCSDLLGIP